MCKKPLVFYLSYVLFQQIISLLFLGQKFRMFYLHSLISNFMHDFPSELVAFVFYFQFPNILRKFPSFTFSFLISLMCVYHLLSNAKYFKFSYDVCLKLQNLLLKTYMFQKVLKKIFNVLIPVCRPLLKRLYLVMFFLLPLYFIVTIKKKL